MQRSGKLARRDMMRAVVAAATLALGTGERARAQQKLSKRDAAYQDQPKGDQTCAGCTLFQPPKSCNVVAGDISPRGWCKLFEEPPE